MRKILITALLFTSLYSDEVECNMLVQMREFSHKQGDIETPQQRLDKNTKIITACSDVQPDYVKWLQAENIVLKDVHKDLNITTPIKETPELLERAKTIREKLVK